MLEVGGSWLGCQANQGLPEFGSLLELYLAQVLLPLGRFGAAEELVRGCAALDSERRLQLLGTIGESRGRWARREDETRPGAEEQQDPATETLLGGLSLCCLFPFVTVSVSFQFRFISVSFHFSFISNW